MADTSIETRWQCDACGELHEFEDDAFDCCRPRITERFICPECGDDFNSRAAALDCLDDHRADDDSVALTALPTAAELEAAGQLRLVP